jgi:polar amino acid transport system substrate-binding protein
MKMKRFIAVVCLLLGLGIVLYWLAMPRPAPGCMDKIKKRGFLLWGADAEGGAPYVFPDPNDPDTLKGFEVEIADAIAGRLGVRAKHVQNAWDSLIPALERGDFDVVMNGIEITPQRQEKLLFSKPYYVYTEQLVVRKDETRIKGPDDLKGKKVGTLSGAVAQEILQGIGGVEIKVYTGQAEPYKDLAVGRLDGVLLDLPIAAYYARPMPELRYEGPPIGEGLYGIAIRKEDRELKEAMDRAIDDLLRSGELKRIYDKWGLWNDLQQKLFQQAAEPAGYAELEKSKAAAPLYKFLPPLLKGAGITVFLSVVSMAVAVLLGLVLTLLRLYGPTPVATVATAYVELYRGTPLLIQLYILYYGLPSLGIALSPLVAAIAGLGMNYAAYEAEIYRAGINAVPKGQMEAALSLGMTQFLAIRRIILPQAIKITLPAITNDFIALFKDSSLVSIIAMVELTKTYNILAATTLRFFSIGLIAALLYFAMSYPLSLFSRKLEERMKGLK